MASSISWSIDRWKASKEEKRQNDEARNNSTSIFMDCDFTEDILKTEYKSIRDILFEYEIFISDSGLHWFLMVRSKEGQHLPYIVFEITTNSVTEGEIIPIMRVIPPNPLGDYYFSQSHIAYLRKSTSSSFDRVIRWLGLARDERTTTELILEFAGFKARLLGSVRCTMMDVCRIAESKQAAMAKKKYDLRTNNCQHFCNKVLVELELNEVPTTPGTRVATETGSETSFDEVCSVFFRKKSPNKKMDRLVESRENGLKG